MDLNELIADKAKASDGVWIPYGEDAEFLIASMEAPAYRKALLKAGRKHPPHKLKRDLNLAAEVAAEAMAESVLLDFKGVQNNGKTLKNTLENRRAILAVPTMREWVAEQAQDIANFRQEVAQAETAELKKGD